MKLRAVRLAEVGMFHEGVALEGLTGGLDVLAGPNEIGKSTLFRAIRTLFRQPHTGQNQEIKDLVSTFGGAPLVEVDFEAAGRLWRVRKRYLSGKSAELRDLGGSAVLRNADAENELARLVSGRLERSDLLGLVWVGQGESLTLPAGATSIEAGLGRLIEDEIADAGGGGQARRIRAEIEKAFESLVSKKTRKPKAGTPYAAARALRDVAQTQLEEARMAAAASASRISQLTDARLREATLAAPATVAVRAAAVTTARDRLDQGRLAAERLQRFDSEVAAKQAALDQGRQRAQALQAALAEAQALQTALLVDRRAKHAAAQDSAQCDARLAGIRERRARSQAEVEHVRQSMTVLDRRARHADATAKCASLEHQITAVHATASRLVDVDAALALNPMTDERFQALRRQAETIDALQARISARAPRVRIDYLPGAAASVRASGRIVGDGETIAVPGETTFDIDGVGRITVTAATATDATAASPIVQLSKLRDEWAAARARLGVTDLAAAQVKHAARQVLANERTTIAAQLAAAAPAGVTALTKALALAEAAVQALEHSGDGDPPAATAVELAATLRQLAAALDRLATEEQAAQRELREASNRDAAAIARIEAAATRLSSIVALLPPAAAREPALQAATASLVTFETALHGAVRERTAWAAAAPDAAALAALHSALTTMEAIRLDAERALQQCRVEIKGLEVALVRDRHDGVEATVTEAADALAQIQARVADFEREVASLLLLDRLLAEEAGSRRSAHLKPVVERLEVYAARVFPGAQFTLDNQLLVRGIDRLSGGTREQIAVLVRMAYAQLAADRGEPLPLVLDDALVYSDDARLEAMFDALARAAHHHQVVVLTCHGTHFGPLAAARGGRLATLTPWPAA